MKIWQPSVLTSWELSSLYCCKYSHTLTTWIIPAPCCRQLKTSMTFALFTIAHFNRAGVTLIPSAFAAESKGVFRSYTVHRVCHWKRYKCWQPLRSFVMLSPLFMMIGRSMMGNVGYCGSVVSQNWFCQFEITRRYKKTNQSVSADIVTYLFPHLLCYLHSSGLFTHPCKTLQRYIAGSYVWGSFFVLFFEINRILWLGHLTKSIVRSFYFTTVHICINQTVI